MSPPQWILCQVYQGVSGMRSFSSEKESAIMYDQPHLSRRRFLAYTIGAAAGLAGLWRWRHPPARATARELSLLTWNHFVPASDDELKRQAARFGRQEGVTVHIDFMAASQLPIKLAAEIQT